MLIISQETIRSITNHARNGMPYEVCGYLAQKDGKITAHYELANTDQAADHFSMKPEEQFAAIKDMRQKGLSMRAVYHSHPETPARPSEEDIKLAYDPEVSYVIISMSEPEAVVKSFRIRQGKVEVEQIKIEEQRAKQ